jgi:hypothetical protein
MNWKKLGRELGMYIIALVVIGCTLWTLYKLFGVEIPAANRDAIMLVIGAFVSKFSTIVDWFFGSSKGSSEKTEALSEK